MMKHVSTLILSLYAAMGVSMHAAAQVPAQMQVQTQDREQVYGAELMTLQERNEYQARMRSLKTEQEREAFRLEHHKLMQERAKAQGKTLPAMPPAGQGGGMGPGTGSGKGGPGPRR
jgi:Na+-translocating ferredoxin:NAD+ oxidoreductase RnfG subunit